MTKPVVDDGLKFHLPLEEASKVVEGNVKLLERPSIGVCASRLSADPVAKPKLSAGKPRMRVASFKTRLGKVMHRLYELEPDCAPEKPLNVDLGVDLYQMEQ